jgi:hypothetical protein
VSSGLSYEVTDVWLRGIGNNRLRGRDLPGLAIADEDSMR